MTPSYALATLPAKAWQAGAGKMTPMTNDPNDPNDPNDQ